MATTSDVKIDVNLAFPKAGVAFLLKVRMPEGRGNGTTPSFNLTVSDVSRGRAVPFAVDASPQLADWARGYTRWLRRASVSASYDRNAITGRFDDGIAPEQVLQGVRDACDMIRQRFELYQESILA